MIYEYPQPTDPIRQGDIFVNLPRIELSLDQMILFEETGQRETTWPEIAHNERETYIVVPVRSVTAVVMTQDCDALRNIDITLCEIRDFRNVERKCKDTQKPKSWMNIITQHSRINLKWFYLPPDEAIGFSDKMAADFTIALRVLRANLEQLRSFRKGRLNQIAEEHFRERIAEFFRRYPYDEWYPLNREEFLKYKDEYPDTQPFHWQE